MSLKTDYLDGVNGFTQKMAAVFAAGEQWVIDNRAEILSGLESAASAGKKTFDITVLTSFETVNLRLAGTHMYTYFAGIVKAMADEDIYSYEVVPSLDTSDTLSTSITLSFTF